MIKLKEIAAKTSGILSGNGETVITGIAAVNNAQEGDITFLLNRSFEKYLAGCRASAVIAGKDIRKDALVGRNVITVDNPAVAYAEAAELFQRQPAVERTISHLAYVAPDAEISQEAAVFPFVYIDSGAIIEKNVIIHPFCFIGREVRVGEGTTIHANVSVYDGTVIGKRVILHAGAVVGSDGFGYAWNGSQHRKIPQLGTLEIGDDVEIGANTCIDRASLGKTVISGGTKIDNLVQIGHNVSIGENSILVSQVGIAGSATIGKNVVLAGQVGVRDHIVIGDNVRAGGQAGITKDVKPNTDISGTPHMPHRDWLRLHSYLKRLPELFERVGIVEKLHSRADNDRD